MALNIPGSEFLTGSLDVISQSLTIPVLVILLVIVIISIVSLGGIIAEYTSRRKVPVGTIRDLIYEINAAGSRDELKSVISSANIPKSQKKVLSEIASSDELGTSSREALARKLFEFEEEKTESSLQKTDIITRIGPTLGLMGTLIPMGPGLAALGAGDINTLASSLTVAFNTTIVGIGSGALCYVIGKIRSGWYERYLSDLDALIDAVLDRMGRQ
jgi:biopolymer transport protein ExbB/TolQ